MATRRPKSRHCCPICQPAPAAVTPAADELPTHPAPNHLGAVISLSAGEFWATRRHVPFGYASTR